MMSIITEKLILSCDTFGVYGLSSQAMKSKMQSFFMSLKQHQPQQVSVAFDIWIAEQTRMPMPADINKLIVGAAPLPPYVPPVGRTMQSYHDLDENQKNEIDRLLTEVKKNLKPEDDRIEVSKSEKFKINTSHFDKHTPQQKTELQKNFVEAHERLVRRN